MYSVDSLRIVISIGFGWIDLTMFVSQWWAANIPKNSVNCFRRTSTIDVRWPIGEIEAMSDEPINSIITNPHVTTHRSVTNLFPKRWYFTWRIRSISMIWSFSTITSNVRCGDSTVSNGIELQSVDGIERRTNRSTRFDSRTIHRISMFWLKLTRFRSIHFITIWLFQCPKIPMLDRRFLRHDFDRFSWNISIHPNNWYCCSSHLCVNFVVLL